MKKILAITAIAVTVSGFTAAEGTILPRFRGEVLTGVRAEFDPDGKNTAQLYSDEYDEEGVGAAITLGSDFDAGNYGASVALAYEHRADQSGDEVVEIDHAFGWTESAGKAIAVKAGLVSEDAFDAVGDQDLRFFDGGSVELLSRPVEGLLLGARARFYPAAESDGQARELESALDGISLGASYATEALTVQAGFSSGGWEVDGDVYDSRALYAQFGFHGVESLTLEADALFVDLGNFAETGTLVASQLAGYGFGKHSVELLLGQTVPMDGDLAAEWTFEPTVSYAVREGLVTYVGAEAALSDGEADYAAKLGLSAGKGEGASIDAFYRVSTDGAPHAVQVDFAWRF